MLQISFDIADPKWKKLVSGHQKIFKQALEQTFDALELPERDFAVAVSFINDAEIKSLNAQFRHKDKATNVLSFPMIEDFANYPDFPGPIELGDIVLAYETIEKEAVMEDKKIADHVTHLLVHGMLHLFGYDHMNKKDEREMEELEIEILAKLGINDPY